GLHPALSDGLPPARAPEGDRISRLSKGEGRGMADAAALHTPVMLQLCLDTLAPAVESGPAVIVDATLGMGGHSEAMLTAWPQATVVGIDRDNQAIDLASQRLAHFEQRFVSHHAEY